MERACTEWMRSVPDRGKSTPAHFGSAEHNIIIPSSTIAAQLQVVAAR